MQANQNEQQSGCCRDFPGASERNYVVRGPTYRYRRYLRSIGLWWETASYGWVGRLSSGRAWYLRDRLGLEVEKPVLVPVSEPLKRLVERVGVERVAVPKPMLHTKRDRDDITASWEYYSAAPVRTGRDARVREGLNINLRGCHWGSEMCHSCMECLSNVEENDVLPHPELGVWGDEEEIERENATLEGVC
jgi:hypothetical protein